MKTPTFALHQTQLREVIMRKYLDTNRLYKDNVRRKVSGVCAGIASHFRQPVWMVRVATLALFLFFPVPIAVAYLLGVLLIPNRY